MAANGKFSIPSKWNSRTNCPFGCGRKIVMGEPITKKANVWGHLDCDQAVLAQVDQKFTDPHGVLADQGELLESEGGRPVEEDEEEELPF